MSDETRDILLVDDEAIQLRLGRTFLSRLGVQVYTAASGNTAIKLLVEDLRPDLIVTDINMPDGTGIDLLRFVRASETLSQVPVIVISGTTKVEEIEEINRLGCEAFFAKPVSFELVLERIARCLGLKTRLTDRYQVRLQGLLHLPDAEVPVTTRDLSAGGACLELESRLEIDGEYTIELQLPEQRGPGVLVIRCAVVRAGPEPDRGESPLSYGVRFLFDQSTDRERRALTRFLRRLPKPD